MKHLELDFFDQDGTEMVRVKEQTHRREEFGKDGTFAFHATNGFSFFSGNFPIAEYISIVIGYCQMMMVMCTHIWRFPLEWGNGNIYGQNN